MMQLLWPRCRYEHDARGRNDLKEPLGYLSSYPEQHYHGHCVAVVVVVAVVAAAAAAAYGVFGCSPGWVVEQSGYPKELLSG
jgi:hypothetical protein